MISTRAFLICALFCTACATLPPEPLQVQLATNPGFSQVHAGIDQYIGQQVRWGGTLQSIHNLANATELEIIARPLDEAAQPALYGNSPGRFIAIVQGFLDPSDFANGREVTIIGTIKGGSTRRIGEFQYRYPIVDASTCYLWPRRIVYRQWAPRRYTPYPYWAEPWDGWYPWYPWWYY